MNSIKRPPLRYHGGKWRLSDWIIGHFPEHNIYIEPFGGGASVLLRKAPSAFEIYNDIDREVWNFFKCLQDPQKSQRLIQRLENTPYARDEFEEAYKPHECEIERAARMVVRSFMGYGNKGSSGRIKTGFSTNGRDKAMGNFRFDMESWNRYPDSLSDVIKRLKLILIENCDGMDIVQKYDDPDTLIYADPPYLQSLRGTPKVYNNEMSEDDHRRFLEFFKTCKSMVVLSGYANEMYDRELNGWQRVAKDTHTVNAGDRTEVLWIKPNSIIRRSLFDNV